MEIILAKLVHHAFEQGKLKALYVPKDYLIIQYFMFEVTNRLNEPVILLISM